MRESTPVVSGIFFSRQDLNHARTQLENMKINVIKIAELDDKPNRIGPVVQIDKNQPASDRAYSLMNIAAQFTAGAVIAVLLAVVTLFSFWETDNLQKTYLLMSLFSIGGFFGGWALSNKILTSKVSQDEISPKEIKVETKNSKELLQAKSILYQNNAINIQSN